MLLLFITCSIIAPISLVFPECLGMACMCPEGDADMAVRGKQLLNEGAFCLLFDPLQLSPAMILRL